MSELRQFASGAIRDTEDGKLDYEGFLSPIVLERFAQYMHKHRRLPDGSYRASDNWQHGFGLEVLMKSLWRHVMDLWALHRGKGHIAREGIEDALCGVMFNAMGYLHEHLEAKTAKVTSLGPCTDANCGCRTINLERRSAGEGL